MQKIHEQQKSFDPCQPWQSWTAGRHGSILLQCIAHSISIEEEATSYKEHGPNYNSQIGKEYCKSLENVPNIFMTADTCQTNYLLKINYVSKYLNTPCTYLHRFKVTYIKRMVYIPM